MTGAFRLKRALRTHPLGIVPGNVAFGAWAATSQPANQGSSSDFGYNQRAIAGWTTPIYDKITGLSYVGVTAWKGPTTVALIAGRTRGISRVDFAIDGGSWYSVTTPSIHPIYGNECYLCPVNSQVFDASRKSEVRAIAYPEVGQPFVLQGLKDVTNAVSHVVAREPDMWSNVLNIDKTGTALPHCAFYLDSNSGSDSNNGLTNATPFLTFEKCFTAIKAAYGAGDEVGGATIYMCAGAHMWGLSTQNDPIALCADQWLTIAPDPAVAASLVNFNRRNNYGLRVQKLKLVNTNSLVCILNATVTGSGAITSNNSSASNYFDFLAVNHSHDGGAGRDGQSPPQPTGEVPFVIDGQILRGHQQLINCTIKNCVGSPALWYTTLAINHLNDTVGSGTDIWDNSKLIIKSRDRNILGTSANHLDHYQQIGTTSMVILEDMDIDGSNDGQYLFNDTTSFQKDLAVIRPNFVKTISDGDPTTRFAKAPVSVYILNPIDAGANGTADWLNKATGSLTLTGVGADGEQVVVGLKTYTLRSAISVAYDVLIGASAAATAANLSAAISAGAGTGTVYGTGTGGNTLASPALAGNVINLTAKSFGDFGDTCVLSTTSSAVTPSGASLSGGSSDANGTTDSRVVWDPSLGQSMGPAVQSFQYNWKAWRPGIQPPPDLTEVDTSYYAASSTYESAAPGKILECYDVGDSRSLTLTDKDNSGASKTLSVEYFRSLNRYKTLAMQESLGAAYYFNRKPTYNASGFNSKPTLSFGSADGVLTNNNSLNGGGQPNGQVLYMAYNNAADQSNSYRYAVLAEEIWWCGYYMQPNADTAATSRFLFDYNAYGGSSDNGRLRLYRTFSGGVPRLVGAMGYGLSPNPVSPNGTSPITVDLTAGGFALTANTAIIVRMQFATDGLTMTGWSAASPAGVTPAKITVPGGNTKFVGAQMPVFGGTSKGASPSVSNGHCAHQLSAFVRTAPLTVGEATAFLALMKTATGL